MWGELIPTIVPRLEIDVYRKKTPAALFHYGSGSSSPWPGSSMEAIVEYEDGLMSIALLLRADAPRPGAPVRVSHGF